MHQKEPISSTNTWTGMKEELRVDERASLKSHCSFTFNVKSGEVRLFSPRIKHEKCRWLRKICLSRISTPLTLKAQNFGLNLLGSSSHDEINSFVEYCCLLLSKSILIRQQYLLYSILNIVPDYCNKYHKPDFFCCCYFGRPSQVQDRPVFDS